MITFRTFIYLSLSWITYMGVATAIMCQPEPTKKRFG